ncbi:MAG: hypothetical protein WD073_03920 [Xanthobacteraceae bacterium]
MKMPDMKIHALPMMEIWKATGIGVLTAVLLSAIMLPAFKLGIAPMPQMPSLAFAETVLGRELPLPVGLLFHVLYVTFWSVAYVVLFRDRLTFLNALWLGLALWVIVLVAFFPVVGWGFLGLGISPRLIPAALVPHLLFALFLWALCRIGFTQPAIAAKAVR